MATLDDSTRRSQVPEVVLFGEAMLRLSPPGRQRLEQAQALEVWPAGAELNTAVGLARLGTPAAWVSRLPATPLGRKIVSHAEANGVDTSAVRWSPDGRLGVFFVEVGEPPRPTSVVYDRKGSTCATLDPDEFDWPCILAGARAFHVTGITPALSSACERATSAALTAARAAGCHTSYDLNHRSLLTTPARARELAEAYAGLVDTVLGSIDDAAALFNLEGDAVEVAADLRDVLGIARVVISSRSERADGMQVRTSAAVADETDVAVSPLFRTVDPLGGGDAFCAGFLHGLLTGGQQRALDLGGAMAALKQSIPGDWAIVTAAEVDDLLAGGTVRTRR